MTAIILAGGRGMRLRPLTAALPKPMIRVGRRPILDIILERLKDQGFREAIIAMGYRGNVIRDRYGNGSEYGLRIEYSREPSPLGTAGPLNLLRSRLTETFLVMNGDILADIDFQKLAAFHRRWQNTATVVLHRRGISIEYGLVEIGAGGLIESYREKPRLNSLISAGVYVFEPEALHVLPRVGRFDIPDFIEALRRRGLAVRGYIHRGVWLDIGRPEDLVRARGELPAGRQ